MTYQEIRFEAIQLGACELANSIRSWKSLAALMMTPQGVEFMQKHPGWPSIDVFRENKDRVAQYGIFVDRQTTRPAKAQQAAFVGQQTDAVVKCHGTSTTHVYVVMHGAKLTVRASNYAVVRIHNLGGTVDIINDGTAKILK